MNPDYELMRKLRKAPHVVILGAGASVATIPNGDKNGQRISVMDRFIDNLGMRDTLRGREFSSENLEDIYSELAEHKELNFVRIEIENKIWNYFSQFMLPDEPTIYDLLVLSLRKKDVIATFNWDPLLMQAYRRVSQRITTNLPTILFLHGNVAVGICIEDKIASIYPSLCRKCQKTMSPCRLLYPIKHKEYQKDLLISDHWKALKHYLERAYIVTVFGYSAPSTDVEAVRLLQQAWGANTSRTLEEIEIIDVKPQDALREKWSPFIFSHHYQTVTSFYDSLIAKHPRRTTESMWDMLMECKWLSSPHKLKKDFSWTELSNHFLPILTEEETGI